MLMESTIAKNARVEAHHQRNERLNSTPSTTAISEPTQQMSKPSHRTVVVQPRHVNVQTALNSNTGSSYRHLLNDLSGKPDLCPLTLTLANAKSDATRRNSRESLRLSIQGALFALARLSLLTSKQPREIPACSMLSAIHFAGVLRRTWHMRGIQRGHRH